MKRWTDITLNLWNANSCYVKPPQTESCEKKTRKLSAFWDRKMSWRVLSQSSKYESRSLQTLDRCYYHQEELWYQTYRPGASHFPKHVHDSVVIKISPLVQFDQNEIGFHVVQGSLCLRAKRAVALGEHYYFVLRNLLFYKRFCFSFSHLDFRRRCTHAGRTNGLGPKPSRLQNCGCIHANPRLVELPAELGPCSWSPSIMARVCFFSYAIGARVWKTNVTYPRTCVCWELGIKWRRGMNFKKGAYSGRLLSPTQRADIWESRRERGTNSFASIPELRADAASPTGAKLRAMAHRVSTPLQSWYIPS